MEHVTRVGITRYDGIQEISRAKTNSWEVLYYGQDKVYEK